MSNGNLSENGTDRLPRRLNLHIPNSHPRATSPRSSPVGSPSRHATSFPTTSPRDADHDSPIKEAGLHEATAKTYGSISPSGLHVEHDTEQQDNHLEEATTNIPPRRPWWSYFKAETTSGESSRDFLARERTYFSWLRLATFLAIASVALFLRLRLRTFSNGSPIGGPSDNLTSTTNHVTRYYAQALAKKALRKRQLSENTAFSDSIRAQIIMNPHSFISDDDNSNSSGTNLDTDPVFSKVLGAIFFFLAVIALIVGHFDYMRCERALEEADKLIVQNSQEGEQDNAIQLHSARWAKQAHSNRLVHIVEIVISAAIFATALIILVTVTKANISPIDPS